MKVVAKNINDKERKDISELFDDADLFLIGTMLENQIRRYENLHWYKEKELQAVYERMKTIHAKLKTYEDSRSKSF